MGEEEDKNERRRKKSVDSERLAKRMKFIMYMGGQ